MIPKPPQKIYQDALRKPAGGYPGSPLFQPAPFNCPNCAGAVFVRIRRGSACPIGATCGTCDWRSTYKQLPDLPDLPLQDELKL